MKESVKIILAVIFIVALGLLVKFYPKQNQTTPQAQNTQAPVSVEKKSAQPFGAIFNCKDKKTITAIFHNGGTSGIDITLSDKRTFSLPFTASENGNYYGDPNGSLKLWKKDATLKITENGTETYSNCTPSQTQNQNF